MTFEPSPPPARPEVVYPGSQKPDRQGVAIASLIIGIVNLLGWCLPICGIPLAIGGIITGVLGLQSSRRGLAIAGIILSAITLLLSIINAIFGAVLAAQGLNFGDFNFDFDQFMP